MSTAIPAALAATPRKRALQVSALLCLALAALLWTGPHLARQDLFNGDAAHHVFWFYQYADPELFPNDLSIEYFGSNSVAPLGYRSLYAALAPVVDVLAAAEWISVVLLALSGLLAWKLGAALGEDRDRELKGLLALAAMLVLLPQADLLPAMGFQRSFALPITLLCLWALVAHRYAWVGVAWVAAALVYPIVIPVLGLAACLVFLAELERERRMPAYWISNAVLGIAAIAIVVFGSGTPDNVGPAVSYEQALTMPEFGPQGRQVLFGTDWNSDWFRHHRTGLGWSPWALLAMLAALGVAVALGYRRLIPPAALVLTVTGVGLWLIARLTLFDLYLPNRHSRWSLAALLIVALAAGGYAVIRFATSRLKARFPAAEHGVEWLAGAAAPVFIVALLAPTALANWQRPLDLDLERSYAFIAGLPKDTLVAAHPDLADYVPLRSRRSVLASTEGWIAFMLGYHERMTPRIAASLEAAYATSWDEFEAALAPYGADVMLSGPSVFAQQSYHPPLDGFARDLIERGRGKGFVLQHPPAERVLFQSGDYVVVRIGTRELER